MKTKTTVLKTRRLALALSQRQLADLAGMSQGHYSSYETGGRAVGRLRGYRIAAAVKADFDQLFDAETGLARPVPEIR